MEISKHAVKRYKQRFRRRSAAKSRIVAEIQRDLKKDVQKKKQLPNDGYYELLTSKYRAVCFKKKVVTITELPQQNKKVEKVDGSI